ncbi:MAG TPA: discoidin domain-containing protein [Kiritimatiellia bacterium]|nr:discoidin domain-containing protein [Kiritimatiellia bacterium]
MTSTSKAVLSAAVSSCLFMTTFLASCTVKKPEKSVPVAAEKPLPEQILEPFDALDGWKPFTEGVRIRSEPGVKDNALAFDYDLGDGREYVVLSKDVDLALPENFILRFWVKGSGPANNLEFKLIDERANVFVRKWENFAFPSDWTSLEIKKDDMAFGWGPNPSAELHTIRRIEFGVSRASGGTGSVCLDELTVTALPATAIRRVTKSATASSSQDTNAPPSLVIDGDKGTRWSSTFSDPQWLEIDYGEEKELIGVILYWEVAYASEYNILVSKDHTNWTTAFSTTTGDGGVDNIDFDEVRARYLKLECTRRATGYGHSLYEVTPKTTTDPWGEGEPPDFFLPALLDFRTDPDKTGTPDTADGWTKIKVHEAWETQGHPGYDGTAWYRTAVYIPTSWSNAAPFIRLTDIRDHFDLYVNGRLAKSGDGARKRCEIGVGTNLAYGAWNMICIRVNNTSGDGGILGSVLVAKSEQALNDGLLVQLKKDSREYYRMLCRLEPEGYFPYWLSGRQGYWTVVGADEDFKESLLCQDGTLEPYKSFSIFPYLYCDGNLITREDVKLDQWLEKGCLPIPSVGWKHPKLTMTITAFGAGEPGKATTYIRYNVKNIGRDRLAGKLFVALRPFEINPPWQWGGFTRIGRIEYDGTRVRANEYQIVPLTPPAAFGVSGARQGGILRSLEKGAVPQQTSIQDPDGLASAAIEYTYDLAAGEDASFLIAVPLHDGSPVIGEGRTPDETKQAFKDASEQCARSWESRLSKPRFVIPDDDMAKTLKANLAFILVNRDGPAIQPGSRGYEAAWIRDGAMTCGALLRMGYTDEVRQYLDWYSKYIYEAGRVPAIVIIGRNEVNPVKEYDSQGELIYLCLQYYLFTRDKAYLDSQWPMIVKSLKYLEQLRNQELQRTAPNDPNPPDYLGILPQSVSHEGYYPEPGNHSYWDDFWALKGWKDAGTIAGILGKTGEMAWIRSEEQKLRKSIYASIPHEMKRHNIDYIPGCAELGDFDPSSTAIAIVACEELGQLPEPALGNTIDRYYRDVMKRLEPGWRGSFSPYEIRIVQAMIYMHQKERALKIFDYLLQCRHPAGWRQWSEAVYFPPDQGSFIGDMPHTWVSSGFLITLRTMFLYERESDRTVVLAAGIPERWLDGGQEVGVGQAPTYWGTISYSMRKVDKTLRVRISGTAQPPGGIVFECPLSSPVLSASINGQPVPVLPGNAVEVKKLPAEIVLTY